MIKRFIIKSLSFLANFFRVSTDESSARLYSFMIIWTGCVMALTFNTIYCWKLFRGTLGTLLNGGEYAIIMGSIAAFITVGIYGKIKTGRDEGNVTINSKNNDTVAKINADNQGQ